MAKHHPTYVYWIDLETTGLDTRNVTLLEIALYRAPFDDPFNAACLLNTPIRWLMPREPEIREAQLRSAGVDPFVINMHTVNGLWDAVNDGTVPTLFEVEEMIRALVPETPKGEHLPVLAGNSVHYDRQCLLEKMPNVARLFSHRLLDVSAVMLECYSLGMPELAKSEAHRAAADVEASMQLLFACRAWQASNIQAAIEEQARRLGCYADEEDEYEEDEDGGDIQAASSLPSLGEAAGRDAELGALVTAAQEARWTTAEDEPFDAAVPEEVADAIEDPDVPHPFKREPGDYTPES